jgi:hypothetical protein
VVRQARFSVGDHLSGRLLAVEVLDPSPRNPGHVCEGFWSGHRSRERMSRFMVEVLRWR